MENQYHSPAYVSMASQTPHQQHFGGFPTVPGQHQQPASTENPTLPPLQQHQTHGYSHLPPLYTGGQHTASPHTPHTTTANSAVSHNTSGFSTMSTPVTSGSMPPPSTTYISGPSAYATSQPPGHASPAGLAGQQAMSSASRLQDIRPMPPTSGYNSPITPFPPFNPGNSMPGQAPQQQYIPSQESEPTHVVGSQGRRGILPSVPGRPPAPPSVNTVSAKSLIPQKDADGKFPCPHCNKTYLHAKHLKRHLLRHTGDRPYMCHLCKDTFSRSDILKRHFQKCSIRRGNPTGANHLAGQRRNTTSSANRMSVSSHDNMNLSGLADVAGAPNAYNGGSLPGTVNGSPTVNGDQSSYASSMASMSARSSRANSLIQPPNAFPDGRHLNGLGVPTLPSSGQHGEHPSSSAGFNSNVPAYTMRPHSASNPVHPSVYSYGPPSSGAPSNNYTAAAGPIPGNRAPNQGNMEWNMFNANGQDGFMPQNQQDQSHVPKSENSLDGQSFNSAESYNDGFLNGIHTQAQGYGDDAGA